MLLCSPTHLQSVPLSMMSTFVSTPMVRSPGGSTSRAMRSASLVAKSALAGVTARMMALSPCGGRGSGVGKTAQHAIIKVLLWVLLGSGADVVQNVTRDVKPNSGPTPSKHVVQMALTNPTFILPHWVAATTAE